MPLTTPDALTVARAGLLLLHTPPEEPSVRVTEAPVHTLTGPLMVPALGKGLTVRLIVAATVPQPLVKE